MSEETTTKTKFQIKSIFGSLLFEHECETIKECVEEAIKQKANLRSADLSYADLNSADLSSADLNSADLSYADLNSANLSSANLRYANLSSADLHSADLRYANLNSADLSYADLSYADLNSADLRSANLSVIKNDLISEVLKLPNELEFLKQALIDGKVDGSTYQGECACLAGTLAKARGIESYEGKNIPCNGFNFIAASGSPRERFFLSIRPGDTPEKNQAAKLALEWVQEAIAIRDHIRASGQEIEAKSEMSQALVDS